MRRSVDTNSSEYDHMARSPLLDHEHGLNPSGLDRIRHQPSRVLTLPNLSNPSLIPFPVQQQHSPPTRSVSSSRTASTHVSANPSFATLEDLHRFPSESLHSFSFAQQSDELLQNRQNILKRSIDFMRDRFGWAASNPHIVNAQARISGDSDLQSMVDLLSRAQVLDKENQTQHAGGFHPRGPITGPADVEGGNVFEKAFSSSEALSEQQQNYFLEHGMVSEQSRPLGTIPSGQQYNHHEQQQQNPPTQKRELKSAPSSRRVSLKRTYTDLNTMTLQGKLMETLAQQSYSATDAYSPLALSTTTTTTSSSLGFPIPALHTHSSKWTPVSQAVFRTEAKAPWTIFAANDLSCLVFGVTQSEVRKLSILEVVQAEQRPWLESKLRDPRTDATAKYEYQTGRSSRVTAVNPQPMGLGNGVTAQLLSKPSSREKARRAQTDDGFGSSTRTARNPNHAANKSRGVLLCGDVVPIQKRNGSKGSASVWVMEKRGGLIWVLEEITENVAHIRYDVTGAIVQTDGDVDKIWGQATVGTGEPVTNLLPRVPKEDLLDSTDQGLARIAETRYFAARTSTGVCIPATVTKGEGSRCLRVSSFPHVAGMMVLSSSTLKIVSSNSVFSAALFGQERPEGLHISQLIPGFDNLLDVLTEEDKVPLVDGILIPEHSFRRARTLSILRDGKANAASIFNEPTGLPANHRDGSTISVDVQLRVVKSGTFFSKTTTSNNNNNNNNNNFDTDTNTETEINKPHNGWDTDTVVTELVYALWITYSRQIHAACPATGHFPPIFEDIAPTKALSTTATATEATAVAPPSKQTMPGSSSPAIFMPVIENSRHPSTLSQQLSEAASQPLTDKPVQPVPEVDLTASKKDGSATKKRTIADYVILEEMGQGAYGQVKLARLKKNPAKKMVLKYVTKKRILVDTWTRDRRLGTVPLEIHVLDFLRRDGLRHPNIVEMEGFFEDDINYYIEMVPHGLPGMDLFDYIELRANMDESECRSIFRQVVDAIHHLHTKALVVHRDIKDENVILDGEGRIKLIDFGSAAYIKNGPFDVFVGTIDYAAPEVLQGKSYRGKEQDIWALGILLYTIVYKENPFYNVDEILDHPLRIPFLPFSEDCIDLIRKMLDRDVDNRLTVSEVLEHPWMT
ncbi:hypothetical protein ASPZODRAFT_138430 [Penicilliopsis zonata CBS 506.65]|uniref:non-specific serine/threonine protein kinase n=1 Tax=Penicilliopsis zonata CBS 506.65 TaxID=1073090 RepID=A0A1L9SVW9_9EURO|nr:hypothetical protein ASPZODRAFT_138430 [Penicilliopsis zonata CBS 506.65]OJJ51326.1 hypothetical protein ASPZODRAFT_138430 [Penicilliopsis zonata CBS 506.65]